MTQPGQGLAHAPNPVSIDAPTGAPNLAGPGPTRVLVVDDSQNDAAALSLELGLSLKHLETRWAESGEQMYQAIAQWQPHIVLTDVHMPRFDIFEALQRLRTEWPALPVVVVSGLVGEEVAARLIRAGASDFVAKSGLSRLAVVVERELHDARERAEKLELQDQLRRQAGLFERVLEHLPVGVCLLDVKGVVRHANRADQALWEHVRHSDVDGCRQYVGWRADTGQPIAPQDWGASQALRHGTTSLEERIEIDTLTGARKIILNSAVPLHDDLGRPQGCFVVSQDITELHHTERRLRRTESTLRALSQRLLEVQEAERRWIAQELHDDIGQGIAAMRFQLARIVEQARDPSASELAAAALSSSEQLNDRLRQICLGLRPLELDDFGLMAALRSMLKSLGNRPALALQLICDGPELRYPARLETAAFRIAQEALNNALRHSDCAALAIRVHTEPGLLALSITDDGCGFAVNTSAANAFATQTFAVNSDMATGAGTASESRPRRLGLAGMAERARSLGSELEIDSQPGLGTTVRVVLRVAAMPEAGES